MLYSKNKQLYKAICMKIRNIKLIQNLSNCYEDVPISFIINGTKNVNAFLNEEGIIVEYSKIKSCDKNVKYIKIQNTDFSIVLQGNISFKKLDSKLGYPEINFLNTELDFDSNHFILLKKGIKSNVQQDQLERVAEVGGTWLVSPESSSTNVNSEELQKIKDGFFNYFLIIAGIIFAFLILVIVIGFLILFIMKKYKRSRLKNRQLRFREEIEMIPVNPQNNRRIGSLDSITRQLFRN